MDPILPILNKLVIALCADNSIEHKKSVLRQFPECSEILVIIYDPTIRFNITRDKIEEYLLFNTDTDEANNEYNYLINLLIGLSIKEVTGNQALYSCAQFIADNEEFTELILRVLNKDLKAGINVKTLNSVRRNLIGELKVPLAKPYLSRQIDIFTGDWFYSRKLDGIRCLAFIINSGPEPTVIFKTRKNRVITTLYVLKDELLRLNELLRIPGDYVIDGELCLLNSDGDEVFQKILSEFRRKDHQIKDPKLLVFDLYSLSEMEGRSKGNNYSEKLQRNIPLFKVFNSPRVTWLPHTRLISRKQFYKVIQDMPSEWEGLILRQDRPTVFKRSLQLLKVKKFFEEDYLVEGIEVGEKKIDGRDQWCCASLLITHRGHSVKVGSGFSDSERLSFYARPESVVGRTVTVKYQQETTDKNGKHSLRHAVFKCIRDYE